MKKNVLAEDTIIKTPYFFCKNNNANKTFINAFNDKIENLGYDFGGDIGEGYCWAKYMIIRTN